MNSKFKVGQTLGCGECFYKRVKFVGSRGPVGAKVVVIAESPGPIELARKTAFIGPGAKLLEKSLPEGIDINDILFMYARQCYPSKVKSVPQNLANSQKATRICNKRVLDELGEHPRDLIIALGNAALWAVTGNYEHKITQDRGTLYPSQLASIGVVGTYHPLFLMRGGGSLAKFKEDLRYAFGLKSAKDVKKAIIPKWIVAETAWDVWEYHARLRETAVVVGSWACGADHETGGFDFIDDEVLVCGFSIDPHLVYLIPEHLLQFADGLFGDPDIRFVWHNGKFDVKFNHLKGQPGRVDEDTMLMNYALDETRGIHDLEQVAKDQIGAPSYKAMLKPYLPNSKTSYREIPKPVLYEYAAYDVSNTLQVWHVLNAKLEKDPISKGLYRNVLLKASYLLAEVEKNGVTVDLVQQASNVEHYLGLMEEPKIAMNAISNEAVGKDINPNSPKQLKELMYEVLKLGNMGMGTGVDVLEKLPMHPFVDALKKYRKLAKAYGTFVKSIPDHMLSDGKVHSTYLIHGAATGRLASRNPNMQNQLRDHLIRNQYKASAGCVLIECDLSQAELRCLATLSGDTELCRIYDTQGLSLHKEVSITLWGEDWPTRYNIDDPGNPVYDRAKEEYMRTKALNFGIVYGREAPSIAEEFEIMSAEAQRWIDGWAQRFPQAWEFIDKCRMAPLRGQNLKTPFGRRKRVGVVSREKLRDLQNQAANFPHQSIASDITLMAAYYLQKWIEDNHLQNQVRIINLIHDAILVDCVNDAALIECIKYKMIQLLESEAPKWGLDRIKFEADAKMGDRWGMLKDVPFQRDMDLTEYNLTP